MLFHIGQYNFFPLHQKRYAKPQDLASKNVNVQLVNNLR